MMGYQISAFMSELEYGTDDLAAYIINSGKDETKWEISTFFMGALEEEIFKMSETVSYSFQIARISNPPFFETANALPIENYKQKSQIIIFENKKAVKIVWMDDLYREFAEKHQFPVLT